MLIPDFRRFVPQLLQLPCVSTTHAAGLDVLRAAFVQAGFAIDRPVCSALVAPGAPPAYWGGFEVVDPVSGAVLRVMASLGYTSRREPMWTAVGLMHRWEVTPSKPHRDGAPSTRRQLLTQEVGAHRIAMPRLDALNEDAVMAYFTDGLNATQFPATPKQAAQFVAGVIDALAP